MMKRLIHILICSTVLFTVLAILVVYSRTDQTGNIDVPILPDHPRNVQKGGARANVPSELTDENKKLHGLNRHTELPLYSDAEAARFAVLAKTLERDYRDWSVGLLLKRMEIDVRKTRVFRNIGNATEWRMYQLSPTYSLRVEIRLPNSIWSFAIEQAGAK